MLAPSTDCRTDSATSTSNASPAGLGVGHHRHIPERLIRIAPGVCTETSPTLLKDYVDVEGSGEHATVVTCECAGAQPTEAATLIALETDVALHTTVRRLKVENRGGGVAGTAVVASGVGNDVRFEHMAAVATGATETNIAMYSVGAYGAATISHVTADAFGGNHAIGFAHGVPDGRSMVTSLTATASAAVTSWGVEIGGQGSAHITGSVISGGSGSVFVGGAADVWIAGSVLRGATSGAAGECADNVDDDLDPYTCTCT